uniref:Uncharacterized protein n=1 Tax=Arundo donax TaxID=35708 RepID=A0A0A9EMY7_ARUDO
MIVSALLTASPQTASLVAAESCLESLPRMCGTFCGSSVSCTRVAGSERNGDLNMRNESNWMLTTRKGADFFFNRYQGLMAPFSTAIPWNIYLLTQLSRIVLSHFVALVRCASKKKRPEVFMHYKY